MKNAEIKSFAQKAMGGVTLACMPEGKWGSLTKKRVSANTTLIAVERQLHSRTNSAENLASSPAVLARSRRQRMPTLGAGGIGSFDRDGNFVGTQSSLMAERYVYQIPGRAF